jgi:hypothetical protein
MRFCKRVPIKLHGVIFQNNVISLFTVTRTTLPFTILQRTKRTQRHHSRDSANVRRKFALYQYGPHSCMPDTGQGPYMDLSHDLLCLYTLIWMTSNTCDTRLYSRTQGHGDKCTYDALGPKRINDCTPRWSRVFLERPIVTAPLKKFLEY